MVFICSSAANHFWVQVPQWSKFFEGSNVCPRSSHNKYLPLQANLLAAKGHASTLKYLIPCLSEEIGKNHRFFYDTV